MTPFTLGMIVEVKEFIDGLPDTLGPPGVVDDCIGYVEDLGLTMTFKALRRLDEDVENGCPLDELKKGASDVQSRFLDESELGLLVSINERGRELLDPLDPLFGYDVHAGFPSAREDITHAGVCLAVGCGTAAVFHLMRVAEIGLRALAYDRRVKIPNGAPIDLATWEGIIKELAGAESAIQNYPKTAARESQFAFYHGAMMQFRAFKNVFRNRVAHARDPFGQGEASDVFERVRGFMQTLSERISEGKRTPVRWQGKKWLKRAL